MKRRGIENGEKRTEDLKQLLRKAVQPVDRNAAPRDLWPQMQARLHQDTEVASGLKSVPWFDWALAGGVAAFAVAFPAAVPVLLYYL